VNHATRNAATAEFFNGIGALLPQEERLRHPHI